MANGMTNRMADGMANGMANGMTAESQSALGQKPMKKWTVHMTDGTVYQGVVARTAEEARLKMVKGPQGPLAPKLVPKPVSKPVPSSSFPESEKARITGGMEDILRKAGRSDEDIKRTTERIGGKLPGSWTEVAGAAVPLAVGALAKPGRTVTRAVMPLLGNILGRAGVEAGSEIIKPTGEGPLGAGARGAIKGLAPGLVQSAAGLAFGPSRATLAAQKDILDFRKELSPELAKILDPTKPRAFLQSRTIKRLRAAAGKNLDAMESQVGHGTQGIDFELIDPKTRIATPGGGFGYAKTRKASFEEIRKEVKDLREEAEIDRRAGGPFYGTSRQKLQWARSIEQDLLDQLRSFKRGNLAQIYEQATAQHARDSEAIRELQAIQESRQLPGGTTREDRPGLAQAGRSIPSLRGVGPALAHGGVGAMELGMGRPGFAAWQLARLSDYLRGRIASPAERTVSPVLTRLPGALGGAGTAAAQDVLIRRASGESENGTE